MQFDRDLFERKIRELDLALIKENFPVKGRPFRATIEIFKEHKVSGPLVSPFGKDLNYPVTPANLSDHISAWYDLNYGNKLKVDPSPAKFPLLIEGCSYECRIPLIFGSFRVLASKSTFNHKGIINAVDHIVDLSQPARERLTSDSESLIQSMFITCHEAAQALRNGQTEFTKSALSDIDISCDLLCGFKQNPSLSAWHSLQFAEKCLKHFIFQFEKPKFTHDIESLVQTAEKNGFYPDARLNLKMFEFKEPLNKTQNIARLFSWTNISQFLVAAFKFRPESSVLRRDLAAYEAEASHFGGLRP